MENYTVLAWLPGTGNLAVKKADGQIGYWSSAHGFTPMFEKFIEAAVYKYGYRFLREPQTVPQSELPKVLEMLRDETGYGQPA